jgi:hypothetical protein
MTSRGGGARPIGESVDGALRALGVPSPALSNRVRDAWDRVAEPEWRGLAAPSRLAGGALVVAVSSTALRQDLAQFHAERLLRALRAALPDDPIATLRFEAGRAGRGAR